ncbi:unnamed protein product [Owenia fusiformis]|uniref:Uncharacterized protein n=2 Tax=Owenia fusiformis TaxID=6347 RepID=A0A8S4Q6W4_OWEFU|nr:unnamed protein product [Owenia fusiformis]
MGLLTTIWNCLVCLLAAWAMWIVYTFLFMKAAQMRPMTEVRSSLDSEQRRYAEHNHVGADNSQHRPAIDTSSDADNNGQTSSSGNKIVLGNPPQPAPDCKNTVVCISSSYCTMIDNIPDFMKKTRLFDRVLDLRGHRDKNSLLGELTSLGSEACPKTSTFILLSMEKISGMRLNGSDVINAMNNPKILILYKESAIDLFSNENKMGGKLNVEGKHIGMRLNTEKARWETPLTGLRTYENIYVVAQEYLERNFEWEYEKLGKFLNHEFNKVIYNEEIKAMCTSPCKHWDAFVNNIDFVKQVSLNNWDKTHLSAYFFKRGGSN